MEKLINPNRKDWLKLVQRPSAEQASLTGLVNQVFSEIQKDGDLALKKFSLLFDKVDLESFAVPQKAIEAASEKVPSELKAAIQLAKSNIEKFHSAQIETPKSIETTKGVECWRESRGQGRRTRQFAHHRASAR